VSCTRTDALGERRIRPAAEVWLTPQEVTDSHIETAKVEEQNVDDSLVVNGRIAFDDSRVAHIFSPVTGRILSIDASLGQHVTKGAPLAVLRSPDIGVASSDLRKADVELTTAEQDYRRKKDLFENHAGSSADLETAEDNYRRAVAERERAHQKAYLLRTGTFNEVTQGYVLVSPIDGEVIARAVNPGIEVQGQYGGGQAVELFTVGDVSVVWVLADLYETDCTRVKVGAKAAVTVVAYKGKVFNGTVDWVSGVLDPNSRTARIRCTVINPGGLLKPEMYANVQVDVEQKRSVAIPRNALVWVGGQTLVFVRLEPQDGKVRFERVPVTVDEGGTTQWVSVLHGLEVGQEVVINGASLLSEKV
jgi:cobalt-zinc-cadmium efflux system membrane fusion protein